MDAMKKTLAIVLSAAILHISCAPASVWASVVAASVRVAPAAGGSGAAGAAVGLAATRSLTPGSVNNLNLSLGSGLFRPAQMTTPVVGRTPPSIPVGSPVSKHAVGETKIFPKKVAVVPSEKQAHQATSQGRLTGMETRIRTAGDKQTSASNGKLSLDAVWAQGKARKSAGPADGHQPRERVSWAAVGGCRTI